MADTNPISSFFFPQDTMSYPALQRRAAIQAAIQAQKKKMPTTFGEGLTYLGESIGDRFQDERLRRAEAGYAGRVAAENAKPLPTTAATGQTVPQVVPQAAPRAAVAPQVPGVGPAPATPEDNGASFASDGGDPGESAKNAIVAELLAQATPEVAQQNPIAAGSAPQPQTTAMPVQPGGQSSDDADAWSRRENAIGGIESGGQKDPYRALGPVVKSGDRAYGKFQVMGANIPQWTQAALGQSLTPQQYLESDEAQNAVFRHRFGNYVAKYGEEGAARAWFAGEKNMNRLDAKDRLGTTVGGYGQNYMQRFGGADRTEGQPGAVAQDGETVFDESGAEGQPTPTTIPPAQQGSNGIPGAFAPVNQQPPPPLTSTPRVQTPETLRQFQGQPKPPTLATTTPLEERGRELMKMFPGDPHQLELAKQMISTGEKTRTADYQRQVDVYKEQMLNYRQGQGKVQEHELGREKRESDLRAADQVAREKEQSFRKAQDEAKVVAITGGADPAKLHANIDESWKTAKGIPDAVRTIEHLRQLAGPDDKMFSGKGAEFDLQTAKLLNRFGFPADPRIPATENFKAFGAPLIAQARQMLVGSTQISDKDLQAARDAVAGDITNDRAGTLAVLKVLEAANVEQARRFQQQMLGFTGADTSDPFIANRQRAMFSAYPLPMENIVPEGHVKLLRKNASDPEALKEFDEHYHTPGLAKRMLQSRRGR